MTVPFLFPFHGAPSDHYRYTACGIWRLLEWAGFCVEEVMVGGGAADVAGMALGMSVPAFGRNQTSMEYIRSRRPHPGIAHSFFVVATEPVADGKCQKRKLDPQMANKYEADFQTKYGEFGDLQCGS